MSAPPIPETPPEPTPAPPTDSRAWSIELVRLLSRLEHLRESCHGKRLIADSDWLVEQAESMVQATEELARRTTFAKGLTDTQSAALARAGAFFSLAAGLKKAPSRGLFSNVLSALTTTEARPSGPVKECLAAAIEALNRYFALFTERFPTSASARRWVDAASAFLADLKQTVGELNE